MKKTIFIISGLIITLFITINASSENILKEKKISDNLSVYEGSGGNSGVLVTITAVVVIDTKMREGAEELYRIAKEKANGKEIIVINTHYHGDHVSGNHLYTRSKKYIGSYDKEFLQKEIEPANMPDLFVKDSLVLDLGDETVVMYNYGTNHTWQDMVVLLKNNKVLFTGDLIFYKVNPFVIEESGANVDNWISTLEKIISRNDYQKLVPGHGEPGGKEIARTIRGYFTDMKAAAADPSKEAAMLTKYKDWRVTPEHATPEITIKYIREHKR